MPFKATVVSTGGGAVVRRQNWGFMHHAIVVWLTGAPELLTRRALRDGTSTRPLLSQDHGSNGSGSGAEEVQCLITIVSKLHCADCWSYVMLLMSCILTSSIRGLCGKIGRARGGAWGCLCASRRDA